MINSKTLRIKYIISDYVAANVAWILFTFIRYHLTWDNVNMHSFTTVESYFHAEGVIYGLIAFPFLMVFLGYLSGFYNKVFFKSRLQELLTTLTSTFIASMIMFFLILINDSYSERLRNYELILTMWGCIFFFLYFVRAIITGHTKKEIDKGKLKFNTLIIGNNLQTYELIGKLKQSNNYYGHHIAGIVHLSDDKDFHNSDLPIFELSEIEEVCKTLDIHAVIISPNRMDKNKLFNLINNLFVLNIPIKISPQLYDILVTKFHNTNLFGEPLIDIAQSNMPESQKCIKRTLDVIFSIIALIILTPIFIITAILIKLDTKGPVFYKQQRIGQHGIPFYIYKFRSMIEHAEKGQPQLSSKNDARITRVGKILRKYRIDETPQFWNVLRGDMSLVGPRPERQFFIDQIIEKASYYTLVYQIRPGITSMGVVKFGYATNIEQMIERTKYDIIYIENMSLLIDLKIILYTIKTVLTGKGL